MISSTQSHTKPINSRLLF